MFYFLSKILFYVLMPISLVLISLGFALFSKNRKKQKRFITLALGLIFLFGNGFLVNELVLWWEVPAISPNEIKTPFDVGIILTGGMITNKQASENQIFTDKTADRFIQPLRLYKMGKIRKILISGGNTDIALMKQDVSDETTKVAQILVELGVKKEDIILETKAKNTRENALNTANVLNKNPQLGTKFLLFSSAYHLKRAGGCFSKVGIKTIPFGTAYISKARSFTIDNLLIPRELNMADAYRIIHEMVGYCVYKLLGYC